LIELLVVISIIGLLSSVILQSLNSARAKARDAQRKSFARQFMIANEMKYDNTGSYAHLTGFLSNVWAQPQLNQADELGPYIKIAVDPVEAGRYIYQRKDYTGDCPSLAGFSYPTDKYSIFVVLEKPTAQDLATLNDDVFDQCYGTMFGMNYRIGN
jgi:type II secretory pathway pseudopilin PulG